MKSSIVYVAVVVVLFLAVYFLYQIFTQPGVTVAAAQMSLLSNKYTYKQGETLQIHGTTTCGNEVKVYVDDILTETVSVINDSYSYTMELSEAGKKRIKVESGSCSKSLDISVNTIECDEGAKRDCVYSADNCEGIEICVNNKWGSCTPVGIVCEPGTRVGCTMPDACGFGFKQCNACGTGYGECAASVR
ncbi:MAG: hypothetical protein HZA83_03050 [Thaumarchaeota archaeon]|nr:hypothetical protein [Nitrososphaerota archaeon]